MSRGALGFASDDELDYAGQVYRDRAGLRLDEAYRRLHLPLLVPGHADAIAADAAIGLAHGRFAKPRRSLVAFVPWAALTASDRFAQTLDRLRASLLHDKIAWTSFDARRDRLHLTIAGVHPDADLAPIVAGVNAEGPFAVRIGGLWGGQRNIGRLYLPCYPGRDAGSGNSLQALQQRAGLATSRFFGIGLINLTDHLDAREAAALVDILADWRRPVVDSLPLNRLAVIETYDSLLLDYRVVQEIPAG